MRIGITMRRVNNTDYPEKRDALSKDWYDYLVDILPEAGFVPLLNKPRLSVRMVENLGINGLILSNGSNWGSVLDRDETEKRLIDYCLERQISILGVCRGMQVLNVIFGGELVKDIGVLSGENHVKTNHQVRITESFFVEYIGSESMLVNSFHQQGVISSGVADKFTVFAKTTSGVVEGFFHRENPIIGIQWHPERDNPAFSFDKQLIREFFDKGKFWD